MQRLHTYLDPHAIVDLESRTKREALEEMCELAGRLPNVTGREAFRRAILEREELVSTGIGLGVAVPHAKIPEVLDYTIVVGRRADGIEYDALDAQPVRLIFMIGAAAEQTAEFVKMLARVVRLVKDGGVRVRLLEAALPGEFIEIVRRSEEGSPPQEGRGGGVAE